MSGGGGGARPTGCRGGGPAGAASRCARAQVVLVGVWAACAAVACCAARPSGEQARQTGETNTTLAVANSTLPADEESLKFPLYTRTIATLACLVIFTIGVCGNLLVPLVVIKTKYLRNSTNLFLINLSVADLLVLIVCMPTVLIELHSRPETWLLGETMCKATNYIEMLAANGSIFTILAISFERYYAICKPLKAGYKCTRLRAAVIICLVWLLASLLTSPILIMAKSSETLYLDGSLVRNCILETDTYWPKTYVFVSMIAFFCLPLLVLMLVYWLISRRLIRESIALSTCGGGAGQQPHCLSSGNASPCALPLDSAAAAATAEAAGGGGMRAKMQSLGARLFVRLFTSWRRRNSQQQPQRTDSIKQSATDTSNCNGNAHPKRRRRLVAHAKALSLDHHQLDRRRPTTAAAATGSGLGVSGAATANGIGRQVAAGGLRAATAADKVRTRAQIYARAAADAAEPTAANRILNLSGLILSCIRNDSRGGGGIGLSAAPRRRSTDAAEDGNCGGRGDCDADDDYERELSGAPPPTPNWRPPAKARVHISNNSYYTTMIKGDADVRATVAPPRNNEHAHDDEEPLNASPKREPAAAADGELFPKIDCKNSIVANKVARHQRNKFNWAKGLSVSSSSGSTYTNSTVLPSEIGSFVEVVCGASGGAQRQTELVGGGGGGGGEGERPRHSIRRRESTLSGSARRVARFDCSISGGAGERSSSQSPATGDCGSSPLSGAAAAAGCRRPSLAPTTSGSSDCTSPTPPPTLSSSSSPELGFRKSSTSPEEQSALSDGPAAVSVSVAAAAQQTSEPRQRPHPCANHKLETIESIESLIVRWPRASLPSDGDAAAAADEHADLLAANCERNQEAAAAAEEEEERRPSKCLARDNKLSADENISINLDRFDAKPKVGRQANVDLFDEQTSDEGRRRPQRRARQASLATNRGDAKTAARQFRWPNRRSESQPIVCRQASAARRAAAKSHQPASPNSNNNNHSSEFLVVRDISKKQQMDSRRQVVMMLAFVVACFFLLFFPYRVFTIWLILSTEDQVQSLGAETYYNLTYFSRILIYLHSAINPIAYNLISTKFRRAFMSILLCRGSSTRRHFTTAHCRKRASNQISQASNRTTFRQLSRTITNDNNYHQQQHTTTIVTK